MYKGKLYKIFLLLIVFNLMLSGCKNFVSEKQEMNELKTTEVETTTSQQAVNHTTYKIITEKFEEIDGCVTRRLEYPQFAGESNVYNDINTFIKNMIININSPKNDNLDDVQRYYNGVYEIVYQTEELISIDFSSYYYIENAAYPIDCHYGLTIDLNTLMPKTLTEYFTSVNSILNLIDDDEYFVVNGEFQRFTKSEIKEELKLILDNKKINTYIHEYYVDEDWIYIIDNNRPNGLGDYSIIKFPLSMTDNRGDK